jgi:predicted ester cyclase
MFNKRINIMSPVQNKETVLKFFNEVCNNGNQDIIGEIFAADVRFNDEPGTYKDVLNYLEEIKTSFDNPHVEMKEQVVEGDFVSTRRIWTGTQKADYRRHTSTGKLVTWTEISIVRFENGKIVEDWIVQSQLLPALDHYNYKLNENDYLELWKFFQNRADDIKGRLWTTIIWHYTVLTGLLIFIIDRFMKFELSGTIGAIFSFLGFIFCFLTIRFITEYGEHINSNWDRANSLKKKIKGLEKIIPNDQKDKESKEKSGLSYRISEWSFKWSKQTKDTRYMITLTLIFTIIFLFLFGYSTALWIKR